MGSIKTSFTINSFFSKFFPQTFWKIIQWQMCSITYSIWKAEKKNWWDDEVDSYVLDT